MLRHMARRALTDQEQQCAKRLKAIWDAKKKELGITQELAASQMNITQSAVTQYLNGVIPLNTDINIKFASILGVLPSDIDPNLRNLVMNVEPIKVNFEGRIPLISKVSAGKWLESQDEFVVGDAEEWLPPPYSAHGARTFALRVEGDSMTSPYPGEKSYPNGIIIYVDPDKEVLNGSRVVARTPDGNYVFKTYTEDMGKKYLKSINPAYPMVEITPDIVICGALVFSGSPE